MSMSSECVSLSIFIFCPFFVHGSFLKLTRWWLSQSVPRRNGGCAFCYSHSIIWVLQFNTLKDKTQCFGFMFWHEHNNEDFEENKIWVEVGIERWEMGCGLWVC